ncbi:MAG: HlyD family efflux transporter periplasmic adaptor subunit [Pseudomonadota bacterium]
MPTAAPKLQSNGEAAEKPQTPQPNVAKPQTVDNPALAALQLLLRVENDAREAANVRELLLLIANETRKLSRSRQIFVVERSATDRFKVQAVSSITVADSSSPLNQSLEHVLSRLDRDGRLGEAVEFRTTDYSGEDLGVFESYPFPELLWVPMKSRKGEIFAGMLQARESSWSDRDKIVSQRLAKTYAHAWRTLNTSDRSGLKKTLLRRGGAALLGLAALAMFIPVPLSALAPAEIVAKDPVVVAAPIEGVIERLFVDPNSSVKKGQVLLSFADTTLRNKFEIAEREVSVARARLKRANQLAFEDMRGRHELAMARADLSLRITERDYAKDLLDKSVIRADRAGIAMYKDKKDLIGKPVAVGERLMELADPSRVMLRIDMPVADGQLLKPGADSKVFLDSEPLAPFGAKVVRADYQARAVDGTTVAFRALADLQLDGRNSPRLGVRGSAQVYGDNVPLGLYLFRRPITAVRQWIGL